MTVFCKKQSVISPGKSLKFFLSQNFTLFVMYLSHWLLGILTPALFIKVPWRQRKALVVCKVRTINMFEVLCCLIGWNYQLTLIPYYKENKKKEYLKSSCKNGIINRLSCLFTVEKQTIRTKKGMSFYYPV